jgi:cysteine desulfurase
MTLHILQYVLVWAEVDFAIEQTKKAVNHLRDLSPLWEMFKEGIDLDKIEWAEH